jgi:hypothetical protein
LDSVDLEKRGAASAAKAETATIAMTSFGSSEAVIHFW